MKILGIETSCDETAVCILEAEGTREQPAFKILGNALYSQVKIHARYGGVFPALAKREHSKNLIPLFKKALEDANEEIRQEIKEGSSIDRVITEKILEREPELLRQFLEYIPTIKKPDIDLIAVTSGPGLEPALWVGINFAKALAEHWNIPLLPINHMEGHILSPLFTSPTDKKDGTKISGHTDVVFPALALLISGGHTELVLMKHWLEYEIIGRTRDDAIGEAFDKVARLLSLPYPGGPEISTLAAEAREKNLVSRWTFPRPMIKSPDFDFSFSGIKTAVLYTIKKQLNHDNVKTQRELGQDEKLEIAMEFENAVTEVLISKTKRALEYYGVKTLILGGGVVANAYIREAFKKCIEQFPDTKLLIPTKELSTDNAVMIAIAGYFNHLNNKKTTTSIKAEGNLSL